MFCTCCGNEVKEDAKFCGSCGTPNEDYVVNQGISGVDRTIVVNNQLSSSSEMSVGDWIITFILTAIPFVGFICLIVWAVSSSPEKTSRKNWAIATFVFAIIMFLICMLFISCGIGAIL